MQWKGMNISLKRKMENASYGAAYGIDVYRPIMKNTCSSELCIQFHLQDVIALIQQISER